MNQHYQVQFTDAAATCLENNLDFKTRQMGDATAARAFINGSTIAIHDDLASRPHSFPQCTTALRYGVVGMRERISTDGYRTLFSIDEDTNTVYVEVVLHQRQDILDALYTHLIIR